MIVSGGISKTVVLEPPLEPFNEVVGEEVPVTPGGSVEVDNVPGSVVVGWTEVVVIRGRSTMVDATVVEPGSVSAVVVVFGRVVVVVEGIVRNGGMVMVLPTVVDTSSVVVVEVSTVVVVSQR